MSDLSLIPLQDGFETQLSQDWDGNTGTVYVLATPSYTPTTTNTYIVVDPGKTNMQIAEITDYDSTAKTLTVSSISFEKGLGISSTAQSHSTGSKVIISDNYQFWEDIQTAINTKLDDTGGTMTGLLQFTGTTHAGIKVNSLTTTQRDALTPANGNIIYNSTAGEFQIYQWGAWSTIASGSTQPNASTTVLGKIKTDVTPAGDPVALISDNPKYDALAGAGGSPSSSNLYETQYDTSNGATKTATTISFTSGTKTIADSGNGFVTAGFKQGTQITITGSASNNGTFTIVSVAAGAIVVAESLVTESAGATVVITTVKADKLIRYNSDGDVPWASTAEFGDGSDGSVTFDWSSTILGLSPSSSIYTLTRDVYLINCTINSGVFINTNGYRIFGTGTLTNNGTIRNNGGNGSNGGAGSPWVPWTGGAAGSAPSSATVFASGWAGTAGANGKAINGNGNNATSPTSVTNSVASAGGTGGAGGQGWANSGGTGWSSTATTAGTNGLRDLALAQWMYTPAGVIKAGTGGGGGGGGGIQETGSIGSGYSGSGGGGGGAWGVVYIAFKKIAGSGSITATGGTGGNGWNAFLWSAANTGFWGGAGGAGGAGWVVIIITTTWINPLTVTVSGGTGGAGWTLAQVGSVTTSTNWSTGANGASWVSSYFII